MIGLFKQFIGALFDVIGYSIVMIFIGIGLIVASPCLFIACMAGRKPPTWLFGSKKEKENDHVGD